MRYTRIPATWLSGRSCWTALLVLTSATVLQADHNRMLQREYRAGISRHVASDSQGYCYLLVPSPRLEDAPAFSLKASRQPHPQSISDFSMTVPFPVLQQASDATVFSTGLVVDSQDRLHLIWTTEQGRTAYSVLETESLRSGKDEADWLNPVTGQQGVHLIAPSRSWAGDICRAPDGRVWLTWTTVADEAEVTVHLGAVHDGRWQTFELGQGRKLYPPSLLLSRDGAFHVVCGDTIGLAYHSTGQISELASRNDWQLKRSHSGNRPALAEFNGQVFAVHESGDSLKYTFL